MSPRSGLASLLLPDETSRRALEETLADWREERRRATTRRARVWSDAQGCVSVLRVILGEAGRELVAPEAWRLFAWTVLIAVIVAALNPFAWAYASQAAFGVRIQDTLAVGWLLIPGGLVPAFLLISSLGAGQPRRQSVPLLASMMLSAVFMILVLGWVLPAARQQFRIEVAALAHDATQTPGQVGVPAPGAGELPLRELLAEATANGRNAQSAQRVISTRLAFLLAVPTGLLLGIAVRKRMDGRVPWRIAQCAGAAALIFASITANYAWPFLRGLLPWPTAVRLDRLQADLWLALAIAWTAVIVLGRSANPEPDH